MENLEERRSRVLAWMEERENVVEVFVGNAPAVVTLDGRALARATLRHVTVRHGFVKKLAVENPTVTIGFETGS